ncbi:MAG: VOC family protein, partial [Candidatus Micrarchaeota archaeon]|nr:VOC family protein [Candidatus Micrarchaeota archaeon]
MDGVVHFELPADDMKRSQKFYHELFGWNMVEMPEEMHYTVINTAKTDERGMILEGGKINGGIMDKGMNKDHGGGSVVIVVDVKNIDASIKKAQALGAKVVMEKMEIPNVGIYARIRDLDGNILGMMQSKRA